MRKEFEDEDYVFYKDPRWKKKPKCNTGAWSEKEKSLYFQFLRDHFELFQTTESRRSQKAFQRMSKSIKLRSPAQCRSHYQKLQEKYGKEISQIVNGLWPEEKRQVKNEQIGIENKESHRFWGLKEEEEVGRQKLMANCEKGEAGRKNQEEKTGIEFQLQDLDYYEERQADGSVRISLNVGNVLFW